MRNRDWSLVIFTSLSQMSIGIILCLTWMSLVNAGLEDNARHLVLLSLASIGVAAISSFLHLGSPSNAPNALNNLAGSWLSREILAIALYALSLALILILDWAGAGPGSLRLPLLLSSGLGLALLWMMTRIYVIPTIPPWNTWYTPLSFVSNTLCLGLLVFLLLDPLGFIQIPAGARDRLAVAMVFVLILEIATGIRRQHQLERMDTGIETIVFGRGAFFEIYVSRLGLLVVATLVVVLMVFSPEFFSGDNFRPGAYLLLMLVSVQAVLGRLMFYASYFRIGL